MGLLLITGHITTEEGCSEESAEGEPGELICSISSYFHYLHRIQKVAYAYYVERTTSYSENLNVFPCS